MEAIDGVEVMAFRDAAAWEAWLADHSGLQAGVWLKLAKKSSSIPSVTEDEVVDIGLCYGWVSGQRRSLDDTHGTGWSCPASRRGPWPARCRSARRPRLEKMIVMLEAGRARG